MPVVILVVTVLFLSVFAISQPKPHKPFSKARIKFNQLCRYGLLALGVAAVLYMGYRTFFASKSKDYDIDTHVYCIELKTNGHRLLGFMSELRSMTLFGEEAEEIMEAAFGNTTKGVMLSWNTAPAWAGSYTARVYYTQEAYERKLAGKSPVKVERNSVTEGVMYRFNICEDGRVYCSFGLPTKPVYKVRIPWSLRMKLFPW